MKRVIITNKQLNEIIKEVKQVIQTEKPGSSGVITAATNPENIRKFNTLDGIDGANSKPQIEFQTPTVNGVDVDSKADVMIDTGGDPSKISTALNQDPSTKAAVDTGKVNVVATEAKAFSKKQIEEARLEKIRKEGSVMTKKQLKEEWEEKPNDDANQWNDEFKMFMQGLRNGEQIEFGDNTIAVEIFKGRTSENDPRYVTFTKGDNRLQDDHFYIQHSPNLKSSIIREIYSLVGWEPDENCEDYYPINEDEVDWNQRKQMRMDNFWDTLEYYIGLKDEQGGLNPEQLADAKDICDKLTCFGSDAEEFCNYAREVLGLDELQENKIKIKPENKGKFNATKKRTGKSTEELTHSKNPTTKKRAIFAQNAKKWNKK